MNDRSTDLSDVARLALRCLDLTELTDTCSEHAVDGLITKALDPRGPVAAICVWPQFVSRMPEDFAQAMRLVRLRYRI